MKFMKTYNGEFLTRPELEALGVSCGGDDVRVHVSAVIINPEDLLLGNHVRIDPFCVLSATGSIKLGTYVHIGSHCTLIGASGIEVADYAGISHGVGVFSAADDWSGQHLTGPTVPEAFRFVRAAPVKLNRHAGVGAGSVILPGVTLGEGSIVGASSLVRKSIPEWTIWAGVPAKRIGSRKKDLLALEALLASGASGKIE